MDQVTERIATPIPNNAGDRKKPVPHRLLSTCGSTMVSRAVCENLFFLSHCNSESDSCEEVRKPVLRHRFSHRYVQEFRKLIPVTIWIQPISVDSQLLVDMHSQFGAVSTPIRLALEAACQLVIRMSSFRRALITPGFPLDWPRL